jgi:hypothetical protein
VDRKEALAILEDHLAEWRLKSYQELLDWLGESFHTEAEGASGVAYQIEVGVFWDAKKGGPLRVLGSIDDGVWRAFSPLSLDFIKAPDGSFVGED